MLEAKDAELSQLEDKIVELRKQAEEAAGKQAEATGKVDQLKTQLAKAKDGEKAAKAALEKAKANPEIPESLMEEMRQQVVADAAAKATEDLRKQLDAAAAHAKEAEKRRAEAEAQLAEAEKKARLANGDIALVSAYLEGVKDQFRKMMDAIKKVEVADPNTGKTLRKNVKEKLLPMLTKVMDAV